MLNDHNDKFDGGEDSEYHFSDEEVSYELEGEESQKPMSADSEEGKSGSSSSKAGFASKLPQSKRMMIAMVAFVGLIFLVYKMIAPSSSVPATDITAATPATTAPMPTTNVANNAVPSVPTVPTLPAAAPAPQPAATVAQAPTLPPQPPAIPEVPQVAAPSTVTSSSPTLTVVTGSSPASLEQPVAAPQQAAAVAQSVLQSVTGSVAAAGNQAAAPAVPSLPAVVPVQSPTAVVSQAPAIAPSYSTDTNVDAKIASMTVSNERMMGQLQGQYTQQMNDFATQNKALQDQVSSLTSRVSVMENQLNQLIQALTRRNQNSSMANPAPAPVAAQPQAPDVKVAYNVQAIIPGRAWLKSDSGETLTVAEGDSIKDVGRVTKIDPYDGVVEINTGSKAISLSYGAGG